MNLNKGILEKHGKLGLFKNFSQKLEKIFIGAFCH
jgi:hypothetical protein